jgi:hypothetical protein
MYQNWLHHRYITENIQIYREISSKVSKKDTLPDINRYISHIFVEKQIYIVKNIDIITVYIVEYHIFHRYLPEISCKVRFLCHFCHITEYILDIYRYIL